MNVLPYYAYPDSIHLFMMEFRTESRQIWKQDIWKWSQLFSEHKNITTITWYRYREPFKYLCPELLMKFCIEIEPTLKEFNKCAYFIGKSLPLEIGLVKLKPCIYIEEKCNEETTLCESFECVASKNCQARAIMNGVKMLCDAINTNNKRAHCDKLTIQTREAISGCCQTIYELPSIFEITVGVFKSEEIIILEGSMNIPNGRTLTADDLDYYNRSSTKFIDSASFPSLSFRNSSEQSRSSDWRVRQIVFNCWEKFIATKTCNEKIISSVRNKYSYLEKIEFNFSYKAFIYQWSLAIKEILRLFPECHLTILQVYEEYQPCSIKCNKLKYEKFEDDKKITYLFEDCIIDTSLDNKFDSQEYVRIIHLFDITGKIISVKIEEDISKPCKKNLDKEDKPNSFVYSQDDTRDEVIDDNYSVATILIKDITDIIILPSENAPQRIYDDLSNSLMKNKMLCAKPITFQFEYQEDGQTQASETEEFDVIENIDRASSLMNLRKIYSNVLDFTIKNLWLVRDMIEKCPNLDSLSLTFEVNSDIQIRDILREFVQIMIQKKAISEVEVTFNLSGQGKQRERRIYIDCCRVLIYGFDGLMGFERDDGEVSFKIDLKDEFFCKTMSRKY
ncbi:unnamed protein product [Moneuplotes crassus]|uniref:Uncharacterized protein n=1 Tax=Euplotes crassus TaxID=5936 RepID=A0AAD1XK57_EUPCR|nr:unnamed protein product [Moneuplotes crassus]